ncbi:MAG: 50S ribosomal protein L4 [Thaumarchaeota archaeon]|nr:50S ribosomal protein L4 [Nitrososphaerota archaeon]
MKVAVYDLDGKEAEKAELPEIFSYDYRPDIIRKAFYALRSHSMQRQGRDPMAGMRTSALSWNTGRGVARMARVKGEGNSRAGQAAGVASVVYGRQAHHPVSERVVYQNLNRKERRLALVSAIAATSKSEVVLARGHKVSKKVTLPLIVSDDIQSVSKARNLKIALVKLNLEEELARIANRKALSGTARLRGRTKKQPVGPLIVVADDKGISNAAEGLPGIKAVLARNLSTLDLAPGASAGRLTIWSRSALSALPKTIYQRVRVVAT